MTVTNKPSRKRLSASIRNAKNIDLGDYVYNIVSRKRGFVSESDQDNVTVDYLTGERDCLPRTAFRRVRKNAAHHLDARRGR